MPIVPATSHSVNTSMVGVAPIILLSVKRKFTVSEATLSPILINAPSEPVIVTVVVAFVAGFLVIPCSDTFLSKSAPVAVSAKPLSKIFSCSIYAASNSIAIGFTAS